MSAFRHLFRRQWWQRTWICQELLFAEFPILLCGLQRYQGTQVISGMAVFFVDFENFDRLRRLGFDGAPAGSQEHLNEALYRNL